MYMHCVLNEFEGIEYKSIDYFKLLQFVIIHIHVKLSKLKKQGILINHRGFYDEKNIHNNIDRSPDFYVG